MSVELKIYVEDVNARIDDGYESIKVYTSTTPETLDNTSTLVTTITLVEDQEVYEYEYSAGLASSWFGYTLYDAAGPTESSISLKWRANETTLLKLLEEVARRCAAGYASVAGSDSSSSRLVDAAIADSAADESFGAGWWAYWHSAAAAANKVPRRVESYASGGYQIGRAWSASPAAGDAYLMTSLMPAVDVPGQAWSWHRAVNEGLRHCRWVDTLNLGAGDGSDQDFSLEAHLGYINPDKDIRKVFVRRTDTVTGQHYDYDWTKNGRWWERVREPGSYAIRLFPAPPPDTEVMVEVRREGDELYALTDTTTCPFEQAVEAGAWRALVWLASNGKGEYAAQAESHRTLFEQRRRRDGVSGVVIS